MACSYHFLGFLENNELRTVTFRVVTDASDCAVGGVLLQEEQYGQ